MSTTTENLNLFKYNPIQDAKSTFNIQQCLNDNWDKIDNIIPTKADITLNNLNNEGKEKFDSPWVSCNEYQIFSNVGLSSSTYSEYTLDFLPDNGVFELNCMYMTNAGANNGYVRLIYWLSIEGFFII